jgi:hypothetical protein
MFGAPEPDNSNKDDTDEYKKLARCRIEMLEQTADILADPERGQAMHRHRTTIWMAGAFAVALALVVAFRLMTGPGERVAGALGATGRWSFALFWLATVGRASLTLFGRFQWLAAHARDLGLSYASAHLVHLSLVVWIYWYGLSHGTRVPSLWTLIFFGIGVIWTYLIALLSIQAFAAKFSARTCRLLRSIGVEYIALLFLVDFSKIPFGGGVAHIANYAPFFVLSVAGPLLRLAAAGKRFNARRHPQTTTPLDSSRA